MKKIFYILPVLFVFIMLSCDDEATVVQMSNEKATFSVSGISPKRGYQGTLVTLTGSYFGVSEELVKVFFGSSEQKAEVISCVNVRSYYFRGAESEVGNVRCKFLCGRGSRNNRIVTGKRIYWR